MTEPAHPAAQLCEGALPRRRIPELGAWEREHFTRARKSDFLRVQQQHLDELEPGSADAEALAAVSWDEVRVDLHVASRRPEQQNIVGSEYAAQVAGVPVNTFMDTAQALGLPYSATLERREIRKVLTTLIARAAAGGRAEEVEQLRAALRTFADYEPPKPNR